MSKKAIRNYLTLRSALLHKGFSLASWARSAGHPVTTVYDSARGTRRGVKSTRIRKELEDFIDA